MKVCFSYFSPQLKLASRPPPSVERAVFVHNCFSPHNNQIGRTVAAEGGLGLGSPLVGGRCQRRHQSTLFCLTVAKRRWPTLRRASACRDVDVCFFHLIFPRLALGRGLNPGVPHPRSVDRHLAVQNKRSPILGMPATRQTTSRPVHG